MRCGDWCCSLPNTAVKHSVLEFEQCLNFAHNTHVTWNGVAQFESQGKAFVSELYT